MGVAMVTRVMTNKLVMQPRQSTIGLLQGHRTSQSQTVLTRSYPPVRVQYKRERGGDRATLMPWKLTNAES